MVFSYTFDYEVMDFVHRILDLTNLSLFVRVEIVLRGLTTLLTVNCSHGGLCNSQQSERNRAALIEEGERVLLPFIRQLVDVEPSILAVVKEFDSPALIHLVLENVAEDMNVLMHMDYSDVEEYLHQTSHVLLHQFYCNHKEFLKAATFYYDLCMAENSIPLEEKKRLLQECLKDIQSIEQEGQLLYVPPHLRCANVRLLQIICSYQIQLNDGTNQIRTADSLQALFEELHRYDLYLAYLNERGYSLEEIEKVWSTYIKYLFDTNSISTLQDVLLQLNRVMEIPLVSILQDCVGKQEDGFLLSILLFCYEHSISSPSVICRVLQDLYEGDRTEENKLRVAELVLKYCVDFEL